MGDFIGRSFGSSTNENYKGPYVSIKNESLDEFIRLVIDETTILNQWLPSSYGAITSSCRTSTSHRARWQAPWQDGTH